MEIVTLVLFLLLAVVLSGVMARVSPVAVPLPLVQIVMGALIASVAHFGVQLDPDGLATQLPGDHERSSAASERV